MATLTPLVTGSGMYPYSWGEAETYSYVPILNDVGRPLFAKAGYITNFSDLTISLSANDVIIGAVQISNPSKTRQVDVADVGLGSGVGALRVLTQDFDSAHDDIAIGDRSGNYASVVPSTSSLRVTVVSNPTSFYQFNNFNVNSLRGWTMSNTQIPMFAVRVKPNQNVTASVEEYEIGNNNATSSTIGYVWYENPTITGSYSWVDLNSYLQYAIFTDAYSSNTPNGISGGTTRHSGIVIGKNSSSEVEISDIPLTGGASPNVLVLAVQRLDSAAKLDIWFAATLGM